MLNRFNPETEELLGPERVGARVEILDNPQMREAIRRECEDILNGTQKGPIKLFELKSIIELLELAELKAVERVEGYQPPEWINFFRKGTSTDIQTGILQMITHYKNLSAEGRARVMQFLG